VKHLILVLLVVAFSASAQTTERGKPSKEQTTRKPALSGADTCKFSIDQKGVKFTIDEAGVKRQATEQQQTKCAEGKGKMPAYGKTK
jgi:hypothetical protein